MSSLCPRVFLSANVVCHTSTLGIFMELYSPKYEATVKINQICFVFLKTTAHHWPIAALMSCIVRIHWTFMPHSLSTHVHRIELAVPEGPIVERASTNHTCSPPPLTLLPQTGGCTRAHKLPTSSQARGHASTRPPLFPGAGPHPAMDSPIVTQLFRQLFRHGHPACQSRRNLTNLAGAIHQGRQLRQVRALSSEHKRRGALSTSEKERQWQQRSNVSPGDRTEDLKRYPTVTAKELRSYRERPRRVKMLMRDFIEGQLGPCPPQGFDVISVVQDGWLTMALKREQTASTTLTTATSPSRSSSSRPASPSTSGPSATSSSSTPC